MTFSKRFPRQVKDSNYPVWEEVFLTPEEEKDIENQCRKENFSIMDESLQDARTLAIKHGMNQEDVVSAMAVALFDKRASHEVFWKEAKAKEKFDRRYKF